MGIQDRDYYWEHRYQQGDKAVEGRDFRTPGRIYRRPLSFRSKLLALSKSFFFWFGVGSFVKMLLKPFM